MLAACKSCSVHHCSVNRVSQGTLFVSTILHRPGATFTAEFVAQRWLASQEVPGAAGFTQLVVFATTSLPQDTTPYLNELRAAELAKIRCEGKPALQTAQRQGAENIYDYQVRLAGPQPLPLSAVQQDTMRQGLLSPRASGGCRCSSRGLGLEK